MNEIFNVMISFLILAVSATVHALGTYDNPRRIEGTFHFSMTPDPEAIDPDWDLRYWMPVPLESPSQRDLELRFSREPDWILEEEEHGNRLAFWDFGTFPKSDVYRIEVDISARVFEIGPKVDPRGVPVYDTSAALYRTYTRGDGPIAFSPELRALAGSVDPGEIHPYLRAKALFEWIVDHMEPGTPTGSAPISAFLSEFDPTKPEEARLSGGSSEYAFLFCALSRALGIPARPVFGYLAFPGLEAYHVWAEFYLERPGWIPLDPAMADDRDRFREFEVPDDPLGYFGWLDNRHLVLSRGTDILLEPGCPYAFEDEVAGGRATFLRPGVWNFAAIPDAESGFTVEPDPWDSLYVNREFGVELRFPRGWHALPMGESRHYALLQAFNSGDNKAKVILGVVEFPEDEPVKSAEEMAQYDVENLRSGFEFYDIEGEGPLDISGTPGYGVLATGGHHPFAFSDKRAYVARGRQMVFLTCTCEKKNYPRFEDDFDAIISSFTVWTESDLE
jgi:hypothetical protein